MFRFLLLLLHHLPHVVHLVLRKCILYLPVQYIIVVVVVIVIITVVVVSCHRPFPPGTSLEAMVIPTAQAKFQTAIPSVLCEMFKA